MRWADIDKSFSKPVTLNDTNADYVPTQILSEVFKNNEYDGIVYKSLVGGGNNIVLFDLDSAVLVGCSLYQTNMMDLDFEEAGNPYSYNKNYDKGNSD